MNKFRRVLRPDAQGFDEIRITTVPRFKTSGLSGDEWRISALGQLLRKGRVVYEFSASNVESAVHMLGWQLMRAHDDGNAYYAGEGDFCDQEGCAEQATVTYLVKQVFCSEPYKHDPTPPPEHSPAPIRRFCERHSTRGNAAFNDADENYELIDGVVGSIPEEDVSPAVFGGTIELEP